jgi:hypothetical protein
MWKKEREQNERRREDREPTDDNVCNGSHGLLGYHICLHRCDKPIHRKTKKNVLPEIARRDLEKEE